MKQSSPPAWLTEAFALSQDIMQQCDGHTHFAVLAALCCALRSLEALGEYTEAQIIDAFKDSVILQFKDPEQGAPVLAVAWSSDSGES